MLFRQEIREIDVSGCRARSQPQSDLKLLPRLVCSSCRAEHDCINVMDPRILGLQSRRIAKMDQRFPQSPAAGQGER